MKSLTNGSKEFGFLILISLIMAGVGILNLDNKIGVASILVLFSLMVMVFIVKKSKQSFYMVLAWIPFILTAQTVSLGSYQLRLYYLTSIVIIILLFNIKKIINNKVFQKFGLLLTALFFSAALSANKIDAAASTIFLFLNMLGSIAIFLLLYKGKMSLEKAQDFIYYLLLVNIGFSIFQFFLYRMTGIPIGLGRYYGGQLGVSQIPGFRTEANTHGKLVCFSILYCIPPIIRKYKVKAYKKLMLVSIVVAILSPTRSASYAMFVAIAIFLVRYIYFKKVKNFMKYILILILLGGIVIGCFAIGIVELDGYSAMKLKNFFLLDKSKLMKDGSANYRLGSMTAAINIWNESLKNRLLGAGYGQAFADIKGTNGMVRVGGNDLLSMLAGGGILGLVLYINIFFYQSKMLIYKFKKCNFYPHKILMEQLLICTIFFFFTGMTSGVLLVPEMWMVFGIGAYISSNKIRNGGKNV